MARSTETNQSGGTPHPPLARYYADEPDRRGFVRNLFDRTARDYDWLNRVMSLGSGLRYRRDALRRAGLEPGMRFLDVAIGTGLVTRAARDVLGTDARVTGMDLSMGMLREARKALPVPLVQGVAERLPFDDDCMDFLTMGFALRHVADLGSVFREYLRVLKPGGTLLMLELTRPEAPSAAYSITRFYLYNVVPLMARLRPRSDDAKLLMHYFLDTVDACVAPATILDALAACGFANPHRHLAHKLFSEYLATKPAR